MLYVYEEGCTDFSTNGNGIIEPTSAVVSETLNGEYELVITHQIDDSGKWMRLVEGCIVRAPVPTATTPRVNFNKSGDTNKREVWRINTDVDFATTRGGTLRLRSGPGLNHRTLCSYDNGSIVQVIAKTTNDWYEVTAPDGKHGFMMSSFLNLDYEATSASQAVRSVVGERQVRDQPFRIYRVVEELDKITAYARHIFYDLLENMVQQYEPGENDVGAGVVQQISSRCMTAHGFTFYSDLDTTATEVKFECVNPVEALLGDKGVIGNYGGELARDWYDVFLVKRVGKDGNVQIRQRKNMKGISYDLDRSDMVTRIIPTGTDIDGEILFLPEVYIDSPNVGQFPAPKWYHLAVSEAHESDSDEDPVPKTECYRLMREKAQEQYDLGCDLPKVTLNVDFIQLENTVEYAEFAKLESIYIGDTVRVIADNVGINVAMRMTQYSWDCILKRYTKMSLGTIASTVEGSIITSRQLPSGIITGDKLAIDSVGSGAIRNGSIKALHIALAAIDTAHIRDLAVSSAKIADAAIITAKIDNLAVTNEKIQNATIEGAKIARATIQSAHIADSAIGTAKIERGSITTALIQDAAITHEKVGEAEIQTANIADAAIVRTKIGEAAVGSAQIEDLSVGTAKIAGAAITRAKIEQAAIGSAQIDDLAVTNAKIANGTIETAKIKDAQITDAKIATAGIGFARIKDLVAGEALIDQGVGGEFYFAKLAVTAAQMVDLTVGKLCVQASNGNYYNLDVDITTGMVTATQATVTESEINAGVTESGKHIIETTLTAAELSTVNVKATEALISRITASRIDVDQLFAREAVISKLTTGSILAALGNALDLSSNESVSLKVSSAVSQAETRLRSQLELTDARFQATFIRTVKESIDSQIEDVSAALSTYETKVRRYMRYDDNGVLTLGESDSDFRTTITNQRMSFWEGFSEVAYISNQSMYITQARVEDTLSIGSDNGFGYFDWTVTPTGLGLKWRSDDVPAYDPTRTYDIDDRCKWEGVVYECIVAITTAEAWNPNHWRQV